MRMIQVKLRADNKEVITWVPKDKRIKQKVKITLKGSPTEYEVVEIYDTLDSSQLRTDWNNNI